MDGIRSLTIEDIPHALELSDAEGWNQSVNDWQLLITAPGNVCLAFIAGHNLVATATAMNYNNGLAWVGMVLVQKDHRGKGISKQLITALLDKLKSCRAVMLDATPAGQPVYEKFGFISEGFIYRMTADDIDPELITQESFVSAEPIGNNSFSEVINYDKEATGINRRDLIEHLLRRFPHSALLLKKDDVLKGFALGRAGARFHHIGPVVAETVEDAKELLISSFACHTGKPFVVDVPGDKPELIQWLRNAGFKSQRHFIRMRLSTKSAFRMNHKYFLIAGPEFG